MRVKLVDDITLEEEVIRDKFLTFTREAYKGKEFKGKPINEPPKDDTESLEEKE